VAGPLLAHNPLATLGLTTHIASDSPLEGEYGALAPIY